MFDWYFVDHSIDFEFKTNSKLDIYKFRTPKSFIMKRYNKTAEEAYEIYKKPRQFKDILETYKNIAKSYISDIKKSLYEKCYFCKYQHIESLIHYFYKKLEKLIDYILDKRDSIPNFDNDLFIDLLKLNSILNFSLDSQLKNLNDIKNLNFYVLTPSTVYILLYILICKIENSDIQELGFDQKYIENEALICKDVGIFDFQIVPILDFINEIYYRLNKYTFSIEDVKNSYKTIMYGCKFYRVPNKNIFTSRDLKNIIKKIMFNKHNISTYKFNEYTKDKLPEKDINYFCCNILYNSKYLVFKFGYKKIFCIEN